MAAITQAVQAANNTFLSAALSFVQLPVLQALFGNLTYSGILPIISNTTTLATIGPLLRNLNYTSIIQLVDQIDQAGFLTALSAQGAKPSSIFSTLFTSHTPAHFYAKSLKFTQDTLPSPPAIAEIVDYALSNATDPGTPLWFILFDLAGGKINDVASNATSYFHRDALLWLQSYTVNLLVGDGGVSARQKGFLNGLNKKIRELVPGVDNAAYPGYVDNRLEDFATSYWGGNVERLRGIKARYDAEDVFRNGQSIRV